MNVTLLIHIWDLCIPQQNVRISVDILKDVNFSLLEMMVAAKSVTGNMHIIRLALMVGIMIRTTFMK